MSMDNLKILIEQAQGKSANHFWLATGKRPTDVIVELATALEEAQRELIKPLSIGELIQRLEEQTGEKWSNIPAIPVAYTLRFKNDDGTPESRINTNTTFSNKEAAQKYSPGGRYKAGTDGKIEWIRDKALDPDVVELYSQEYVATLLAALKLEQEQSAYYERYMWHFHGIAESESQRAEAAEQRLQQPINLPDRYSVDCGVVCDPNGDWLSLSDVIAALKEQGFTVEGE
ncbi:hypothetical protein SAQUA_14170 [Serratia aquatilis]